MQIRPPPSFSDILWRTCGHPESTCLSEEIPMLWQAFMTGCVNADAGKVNSISDVRMGNLYQ